MFFLILETDFRSNLKALPITKGNGERFFFVCWKQRIPAGRTWDNSNCRADYMNFHGSLPKNTI